MRVLAVFCAGCATGSRWEETSALCQLEPRALDAASFVAPPQYPSTGCVDAVLSDFGADIDALLAHDGLSDPYGLVFGEDIGSSATGRLLWAAHALLTADLGTVDAMEGVWARGTFRQVLSGAGHASVTASLYDYAARRIGQTRPGQRPDALAGMQGDTLLLYDLPAGIDGAAVLVHEARHRDGFEHVSCQGEPICDRDQQGSWGFELAVHELARDHSDDELARSLQQSWLNALTERILWR